MENIETYSVVITVFNDEKEIRTLVHNIQEQSYSPAQIIIVDGGSKDKTCSIIEEMAKKDERIVLLSGERLNISQGLNKGIKFAKQEYVGIVATGNKYENDFFEKLLIAANESSSDFTYALLKGEVNNAFQSIYSKLLLNEKKGIDYGIATNHGVLCKKTAVEGCGYFYEDFVYAGEDAEFFQRAKDLGYKFNCVKDTVIEWNIPGNIKQYKRQIKNYVIGQLQILHGKKMLKFYFMDFVVSMGYLLGIIPLVIILCNVNILSNICMLYVLLLLFYVIIGTFKNKKVFLLKQYMHAYTCFSILKNIKYNKKKYAVIR